MSKKLTFGKLLGIIFCILAAAVTIVLLCANAYFSGQMKLIDKFYTAIERDDFEGFKACFSEVQQEFITEEKFAEWRNYTVTWNVIVLAATAEIENPNYSKSYSYPIDTDEYKAKVDFVERHKAEKDKYFVTYKLMLYKDTENENFNRRNLLVRQNGKWVFGHHSEINPFTEVYSDETGEMLKVLYRYTGSGRADYKITGDDIISLQNTVGIPTMVPNEELRIGSAIAENDFGTFGWNFKPKNAGKCTITVNRYDLESEGISYTDIYNVTVDENMKITYTLERTNIEGDEP